MPRPDVGSDAAREASLFGRYLLDRDPPAELINRYVEASGRLFSESPSKSDAALVAFVLRHPVALPFVDAAAGLLRPGSLLRNQILLMAAILEASVHHASEFLAPPPGRARTLLSLSWYGLVAGIKFAVGAVILAAIPSGREGT